MPRLAKISTHLISWLAARTSLNEVASQVLWGDTHAEAGHAATQELPHARIGAEATKARSRKFLLFQGLHDEHPLL